MPPDDANDPADPALVIGPSIAAPAAPRLYYGWIILGGLSLTEIVSWGILYYGFGVLLPPMQAELGWSASALSGAFSIGLLASAIVALPLGRYIDRHGARGVMTAGSCLAATLLLAWSQVTSLWAFYAIWAGLGVAMAAVLYEPAFALLIAWFVRRRDAALSVLTSVGGLASTVFVPIVTWLMLRLSWRTALVVLAAGLAIVTIPVHAFVLRSRPRDVGLHPDGDGDGGTGSAAGIAGAPPVAATVNARAVAHASGTPRLAWMLAATFGLTTLSAAAVAVHIFPYLLLRGHRAETAAFTLAMMGAAQVPGRMLFAALTRRIPSGLIAPAVFSLQVLGLASLALVSSSPWFLACFALLFGAGNGLTTLVRSTMVADVFGVSRFGAMSGTVAVCGHLSRAAGPILVAALAARFSYEPIWWSLAVAVGCGAVVIHIVRPRRATPLP